MSNNNVAGSTASTADVQPANQIAGTLGAFAPILLMIVFFYFLILRPQQKREAARRALVNSAKKGDKVVTSSGLIGTVHKIVSDEEVSLEVAENVRVRILKNSIANILDKKSDLGIVIAGDGEKEKKTKKKKADISPESEENVNDSIIKFEK